MLPLFSFSYLLFGILHAQPMYWCTNLQGIDTIFFAYTRKKTNQNSISASLSKANEIQLVNHYSFRVEDCEIHLPKFFESLRIGKLIYQEH